MTLKEKQLYQQIHPMRLVTDWSTGMGACWLFWINEMWFGVLLAFLPSLIVSLLIVRYADLEKIKNSKFGAYFLRTYNKIAEFIRFIGFFVLASGSWWHSPWVMAAGFLIIAGTWVYGVLLPKKNA